MTDPEAPEGARERELRKPNPAQISRARERFAEIAGSADDAIDIAEAALWLAAEACADLDVAAERARIDALADDAGRAIPLNASRDERIEALNRALFIAHGFQGERVDYYDPRNSFLNSVVERRRGIPIALCVLYITVARKNGLLADGVSFPGHFLVRVRLAEPGALPDDADVLIDAFEGETLTQQECQARLLSAFGPQARLTPEILRAASNKEILLRMLSNLKSIYVETQQFEEALGCCDRALLLTPNAALEHRDRGLVYHQLDCARPAATDLARYLELAPDDPGAPAVRKLLDALRSQLPHVH